MQNNNNWKNRKRNMKEFSINERMAICNRCPIYNPNENRCNSRLWINPDTDEVSTIAKSGFVRGCGCAMKYKVSNPSNHCVAGKW